MRATRGGNDPVFDLRALSWRGVLLGAGVLPRCDGMFSVLGLCPDATLRDVRRAYRRLALVHHPDRGGDAARFREITDAFEQITQGSGMPRRDHTLE